MRQQRNVQSSKCKVNRALFHLFALCTLHFALGIGEAEGQRQSWTADRRTFGEGDVLTVVLDEYTVASQSKGNTAISERSRDSDVDAEIATPGAGTRAGARVGSGTSGRSRESGDAVREAAFQGEVTVRVVEIAENGMLRVEGSKKILVDRSEQTIAVSGLVRTQDVSSNNVVESWRVADLDLRFTSKGGLDEPKGGILSKILGKIWP